MAQIALDPSTGQVVKEYPEMTDAEVASGVARAEETFQFWRRTSLEHRADLMHKAAEVLRSRKVEYAELMASEMGKPLQDGEGEVEKCAWVCDFYADKSAEYLAEEQVDTEASEAFVTFQPLGVVLAVMPWNFPFWQVMRFAAPGLMAGNVGVLKHASNVPGCALAIEDVFRTAGFPEGTFTTLLIGGSRVASVIKNTAVKAVTLTGSTPAGRSVAATAGSMLKKTVLELGGSDPYVLLADADVPAAAATCVASRMINAGQSCVSAKRFIVVEEVKDEFERLFVELMKQKVVGDPRDEGVSVGPMARHDLRDELHKQVIDSVDAGARLLLGGTVSDDPGAFYPATVLTDVKRGMPAYSEEFFGPVASIIPVADEDEAIRTANDSPFGLGAAVFTGDIEKGRKIAAELIDAGAVFVNDYVKSDPRLPFGGIKQSGYGRELSSYGIREFVNIKSVVVR